MTWEEILKEKSIFMKFREELNNLLRQADILVGKKYSTREKQYGTREEAFLRKVDAFLNKLKDSGITAKTDKGQIFFDAETTKNLKELIELAKYYNAGKSGKGDF